MKCPNCGSPAVAIYTHTIVAARKTSTWSECAHCFDKRDEPFPEERKSTLSTKPVTVSNVTRQSIASPSVRAAKTLAGPGAARTGDLFAEPQK